MRSGTADGFETKIPDMIRSYIRHEMEGLPTAALAEVRTVDEDNQRATVETIPDGVKIHDVPIATTFGAQGHGDISPINPDTCHHRCMGVVVYVHHDIESAMSGDKKPTTIPRGHDEESMVFIPAIVWADDSDIPEHDPGERLIGHHSGVEISMTDEAMRLTHPNGSEIEIGGVPEETVEGEKAEFDVTRNFDIEDQIFDVDDPDAPPARYEWPVESPGDAYTRIAHPGGAAVTITDDHVAIETEGQEVSVGTPTDGDRRVVDGPYQHAQLVHHDDGQFSMVGEPLSFREFVAWLTDPERLDLLKNRDAEWVEEASIYAEAYLEWIREREGEDVDPTDAETWPDPEPMPDMAAKEDFMP